MQTPPLRVGIAARIGTISDRSGLRWAVSRFRIGCHCGDRRVPGTTPGQGSGALHCFLRQLLAVAVQCSIYGGATRTRSGAGRACAPLLTRIRQGVAPQENERQETRRDAARRGEARRAFFFALCSGGWVPGGGEPGRAIWNLRRVSSVPARMGPARLHSRSSVSPLCSFPLSSTFGYFSRLAGEFRSAAGCRLRVVGAAAVVATGGVSEASEASEACKASVSMGVWVWVYGLVIWSFPGVWV